MSDIADATSIQPPRDKSNTRATPITAKHILFTILGLMTLFVLWNNERFLLDSHSPAWTHFAPIRWHLIPHGIFGAIALVLGAGQFSTRLRLRYPRIHRFNGRLYVISMFIFPPVAIHMAIRNSPWFMTIFTITQAPIVMAFTFIGYACIRRGQVRAHRQWMARSYAVVLIFVEGRVLMAIPALDRGGMDSIVLVNWLCLTLTLLIMELAFRWHEVLPPKKVPAHAT